jgi:hypothetical protein
MQTNSVIDEIWEFWTDLKTCEPKHGVYFRESKLRPTGDLTVWIIDDSFDGRKPEGIGDDRLLVLGVAKELVQLETVSRVVVCQFDSETIPYLRKTHLKVDLAQGKVCLLLDLFDGESNQGRKWVDYLVAKIGQSDPTMVSYCQASTFSKKWDSNTNALVTERFLKPHSGLIDSTLFGDIVTKISCFLMECSNRHANPHRKRVADKEMEALSKALNSFHNTHLSKNACGNDSNHEVSDCLAHPTESCSMLKDFATGTLLDPVVDAIKKWSVIPESLLSSLFYPLKGGSSNHELAFSLSKSLSLRHKTGKNYVPGYWLNCALGTDCTVLNRYAFELSNQVSWSAFLASLYRLREKCRSKHTAGLLDVHGASSVNLKPLEIRLTIDRCSGDWEFFAQQVSRILVESDRAGFPEGKHGTLDALANMRLSGFCDWRITLQNGNTTSQLVAEATWSVSKLKILD